MSDLTTSDDASLSPQTAEHVLATGDLSKLSSRQKVELYLATCRSLRVNPLSRPFRFLRFQGSEQLYATRDLADQLRHRDRISIEIVSRTIDGGVYAVTARATTPDGRKDEDVGAVPFDRLVGEFRSNALMKATTKAKRRVTLSICGLGFVDESEVESLKGAQTWDYDEEAPKTTGYVADDPKEPAPERTKEQWEAWLARLNDAVAGQSREVVEEVGGRKTVRDAAQLGPQWVQDEIRNILGESYGLPPP